MQLKELENKCIGRALKAQSSPRPTELDGGCFFNITAFGVDDPLGLPSLRAIDLGETSLIFAGMPSTDSTAP
jgi:hypothetical protein